MTSMVDVDWSEYIEHSGVMAEQLAAMRDEGYGPDGPLPVEPEPSQATGAYQLLPMTWGDFTKSD